MSIAPRPIRVLLAINTLDRGGAERQLVELANGLDRARFEVSVACVVRGGPLGEELAASGIPVSVFDARGPLGLYRLTRHIRRVAPDIVHTFLFGSNVIGTLAAKTAGVPIVITSRRSLGFFKDGRPHYALFQSLANRFTDVVVANSEAVRQDTLRRERLDPAKVRLIANGVDVDRFTNPPLTPAIRTTLGLGPGPLVVVVANLIPYKGLDYFVDAWGEVVRSMPAARAVVVGDGPARADLEARATKMGDSIRFIGSRDDVATVLAAADLVVQSSLYEGFPNAMLEAMAAGRPVVATAVGGTAEAVVAERTGVLVPPRDSAALAAAMVRLLGDRDLAERFGRAGQARVSSEFSVSQMVRRYADLYMAVGPHT
jgi:glycosyltransferase involved in cell wall biosynthesis